MRSAVNELKGYSNTINQVQGGFEQVRNGGEREDYMGMAMGGDTTS